MARFTVRTLGSEDFIALRQLEADARRSGTRSTRG
jgi:hypothetical protein